MFPYFNRPPYSQYPVRAVHMLGMAALLLPFAAVSYLGGVLFAVRLLLIAMMLYVAGL